MSDITKETWRYDEETGLVMDEEGVVIEVAVITSRARAFAILPEALALLNEMQDELEDLPIEHMERMRDILRRAGVLK